MGSRRRNYIQDERQFRGVLLLNGEVHGYTGPYSTPAKAKASITRWKAPRYRSSRSYDGYVEYSDPQWNRYE